MSTKTQSIILKESTYNKLQSPGRAQHKDSPSDVHEAEVNSHGFFFLNNMEEMYVLFFVQFRSASFKMMKFPPQIKNKFPIYNRNRNNHLKLT